MQHSFFSALEFHSQSSPMLGRWEILGGKVDTSSLHGRTIPMDLVLRLVQWRKAAGMSRKSRICMGLEPGLPSKDWHAEGDAQCWWQGWIGKCVADILPSGSHPSLRYVLPVGPSLLHSGSCWACGRWDWAPAPALSAACGHGGCPILLLGTRPALILPLWQEMALPGAAAVLNRWWEERLTGSSPGKPPSMLKHRYLLVIHSSQWDLWNPQSFGQDDGERLFTVKGNNLARFVVFPVLLWEDFYHRKRLCCPFILIKIQPLFQCCFLHFHILQVSQPFFLAYSKSKFLNSYWTHSFALPHKLLLMSPFLLLSADCL